MPEEFRLHTFVCTNQRDPEKPRECCAAKNSLDVMTRLKRTARAAGIKDVRVNKAGCLDRCEKGISCVVYPDGIWYQKVTPEDIDEILDQHVGQGKKIDRLEIPDELWG